MVKMIRRSITFAKDVNDKIIEIRGKYMLEYKSDRHLDYSNVVDCLLRFALQQIPKLTPEIIKAQHNNDKVKIE